MRLGFIGLGHLGSAILKNLLSRGYAPTIWNRTPEKAEGYGTPVAATPREVVEASDIVLINVYDSTAVHELLHRDDGLLTADMQDKIIADMTTNDHESVLGFSRDVAASGGQYLECPVIGTVPPALQGQLTMLVSGDEEAFTKARPVLDEIATPIIYLKDAGNATRMKLINNQLMARMMGGIAESLVMAEKSGIGRETAIEVLENGAGNCMLLKGKKNKLIDEDFTTHFSVRNLSKDLGYAQELGKELGLRPYTDVLSLFKESEQQESDFSAIVKDLEHSQ